MEIGVARHPYQDWRWHNTMEDMHPSAVLDTSYGRLLAGREVTTEKAGYRKPAKYTTATSLYRLDAQHVSRTAAALAKRQ